MTKDKYTKRLEEILDEQFKRLDGTTVLPIYNRPTAVGQAITAIQQLNNEAIGGDSYWYVDDDGVKQYNTFNSTANGVKRELRAVIGQDNE